MGHTDLRLQTSQQSTFDLQGHLNLLVYPTSSNDFSFIRKLRPILFFFKKKVLATKWGYLSGKPLTKKFSSNIGVRAGRLPIENFIKSQALLYLARLNNENINPFLKETDILSENLDKQDIYSQFSFIKDINITEIVKKN